jgi:hypothetical protein
MNGVAKMVGTAILLLALLPSPAVAYIDPISGSILLQILAAGVLGAVLTVKRFWNGLSGAARNVWRIVARRGDE